MSQAKAFSASSAVNLAIDTAYLSPLLDGARNLGGSAKESLRSMPS
jgi:hypothetical protein